MLPTLLQKREAASDWDERVFHKETCTSLCVCTLSVPEEGCLAIQAGHYYLGGFALLLKCYMLLINTAMKGQAKGQTLGVYCSRKRAL